MIKAVLIVSVSLMIALLGFGAAKITFPSQKDKLAERLKQKTGEATPIQEGVMTDKQKKHSRLFKGFGDVARGRKLRDLVAQSGDVNIVQDVGDVIVPRSFNLDEYLRNLTCKADAVVIATVRSKSSNLIEEGTFVFTDYKLTVIEILKNNAATPIESSGLITFTSPGGAVELNGHTIRAVDYRNEPLQAGVNYLLYLKFIPETNSFKPFSDSINGDAFQLKDGTVIQASEKPLPFGTRRTGNVNTFMGSVRAALNQVCAN